MRVLYFRICQILKPEAVGGHERGAVYGIFKISDLESHAEYIRGNLTPQRTAHQPVASARKIAAAGKFHEMERLAQLANHAFENGAGAMA